METHEQSIVAHPAGELPMVEARSAIADTFAGRVHVEWDAAAPVTPFGQLPFFIDYLKQAGLFEAWVADCPLSLTSPNAPKKRDLLGTVLLSVLAGHRRYAHITALRCETLLHGHAMVVGRSAAPHIESSFTPRSRSAFAVQVPCRTTPSHPQAAVSGHELGGV
jgi:hypothetical protein